MVWSEDRAVLAVLKSTTYFQSTHYVCMRESLKAKPTGYEFILPSLTLLFFFRLQVPRGVSHMLKKGTVTGKHNVLKHRGAVRKWMKCVRILRGTLWVVRNLHAHTHVLKRTHITAFVTNTETEKLNNRQQWLCWVRVRQETVSMCGSHPFSTCISVYNEKYYNN